MNLNEFVNKYESVLHALAGVSIPDWKVIAYVENNVEFVDRVCRKRFVFTAINKSHGTDFDVEIETWVTHTLDIFDDHHDYEVLVGVNVNDLKGARPIKRSDLAYKFTDGLLLVGAEPDDFKTLDEWLEVIIDSIKQIQVHL